MTREINRRKGITFRMMIQHGNTIRVIKVSEGSIRRFRENRKTKWLMRHEN